MTAVYMMVLDCLNCMSLTSEKKMSEDCLDQLSQAPPSQDIVKYFMTGSYSRDVYSLLFNSKVT